MNCFIWRVRAARGEEGQIAVLIVGLFVLVLVLIFGGIDVTSAQLGRMRLLDVADATALDAADALDEGATYSRGVSDTPVLTNESVRAAAAAHLERTPRPPGLESWHLGTGTGTPDGRTAVVLLTGRATLPMSGWVLDALGGGVTITVESRARAPLR